VRRTPVLGPLAAIALLCSASGASRAEVIAFEQLAEEPYGSFAAGAYVRVSGRVGGALDTSEAIPGIEQAEVDHDGRVTYRAELTLIVPAAPDGGNGTLIVDVPNRGRAVAHTLYNSPREAPVGGTDAGTGFLQDQGFLLAIPAWELGHGIELPSFVDDAGARRHIEGIGLAAVRDIAAWLKGVGRHRAPNPLEGRVEHALAVGYSQTARLLKTFLLKGFNTLVGVRVLDGMHLQGGHAGLLPVLATGTGPHSSASPFPTFTAPDLRGVHEPPFTYDEILAAAHHDGLAPPRLVVTNMASDYYSLRASLARTGSLGTSDRPLPESVRMYDVAGSAHVISAAPGCEAPRGHLDWHPVMRALLLHLERWVKDGAEPPASGLMPLAAAPSDIPVLGPPPSAPGATILVPATDRAGNDQGGVRLPDIEAPLGTHRGHNGPLDDVGCTLSGAFVRFAPSEAERAAAGDPRPSLETLYEDAGAYLARIKAAADALVAEGFMLAGDAARVVEAAGRVDLFK
jgi:hypothetical protein